MYVEHLLKRNDRKIEEFTKVFSLYAKEGFAEEITSDNNCKRCEKLKYLPHPAVYREDKSTSKTGIFLSSERDEAWLDDSIL